MDLYTAIDQQAQAVVNPRLWHALSGWLKTWLAWAEKRRLVNSSKGYLYCEMTWACCPKSTIPFENIFLGISPRLFRILRSSMQRGRLPLTDLALNTKGRLGTFVFSA